MKRISLPFLPGPGRLVFRSLFLGIMAGLLLAACSDGIFGPSYTVELPPPPPSWLEILGNPHWRLEWVNDEGLRESRDLGGGELPEISLLTQWTVPVLASPYWPERGIPPGIMRPAGGLFPYDAGGNRLRLSWKGGVEARVYFALAAGNVLGKDPALKTPRQPQYFNWPQFREFLAGPGIAGELRKDPWLADWDALVLQILQSGFNKRRILPEPREILRIPGPLPWDGPWIGSSPFAEGLFPEPGGDLLVPAGGTVDTYLSPEGFLRCSKGVWAWIPWK